MSRQTTQPAMLIPTGDEGRCPICGAEAVLTAGGKRTVMTHDPALHRRHGEAREPERVAAAPPRRTSWHERYD